MLILRSGKHLPTISPVIVRVCSHFHLWFTIADQEHNQNQEDEEEAAAEDREERHAGSDAEGAEADCQRQGAEKQQG